MAELLQITGAVGKPKFGKNKVTHDLRGWFICRGIRSSMK